MLALKPKMSEFFYNLGVAKLSNYASKSRWNQIKNWLSDHKLSFKFCMAKKTKTKKKHHKQNQKTNIKLGDICNKYNS